MYENILKFPEVLLAGSLFLTIPLSNEASIIKKLVCGYMVSVYVNLLGFRSISFDVWGFEVNVVCDVFIVAPLLGYLLLKKYSYKEMVRCELFGAGMISIGVLLVHMGFMLVLLIIYYGYGFERDIYILWQVLKLVLVFICISRLKPGVLGGICNYFFVIVNGLMVVFKWI